MNQIVESKIGMAMTAMFPHGAGTTSHARVGHWLDTVAQVAFREGEAGALMCCSPSRMLRNSSASVPAASAPLPGIGMGASVSAGRCPVRISGCSGRARSNPCGPTSGTGSNDLAI